MPSCPQLLRPSDRVRPRSLPQNPLLTLWHCSKRPCAAVHCPALRRLCSCALPDVVLQRQVAKPRDMCGVGLHVGWHRLSAIADGPRKQPRSVFCDVLHHKWNLHGHRCYNRVVYVPLSALYPPFLIWPFSRAQLGFRDEEGHRDTTIYGDRAMRQRSWVSPVPFRRGPKIYKGLRCVLRVVILRCALRPYPNGRLFSSWLPHFR